MNEETPVRKDKFRRYRASKRELGLREMRRWVPDVNAPGFRPALQRQIKAINASAEEAEVLAWIESNVAEVWGMED